MGEIEEGLRISTYVRVDGDAGSNIAGSPQPRSIDSHNCAPTVSILAKLGLGCRISPRKGRLNDTRELPGSPFVSHDIVPGRGRSLESSR